MDNKEGEEGDSGKKDTPEQSDPDAASAVNIEKESAAEEGAAEETVKEEVSDFEDLLAEDGGEKKEEEEKKPSYEALVEEVEQRGMALDELKKKVNASFFVQSIV